MERFQGKVAVVTGCTSGIGLEISKELIKEGLVVVGIGRRKEKLQDLKEEFNHANYRGKFYPYAADISEEKNIVSMFQWTTGNVGCPSILINNAAVLIRSKILDYDSESVHQIFNTNVIAYFLCIREAIKLMKENGIDGHIVNIGSILGKLGALPKPALEMHSAAKHAVRTFTEGLRRELIDEESKIKITLLNPGMVQTGMADSASKLLPPTHILNPKNVAKVCMSVLNTPPEVIIPEVTVLPILEK